MRRMSTVDILTKKTYVFASKCSDIILRRCACCSTWVCVTTSTWWRTAECWRQERTRNWWNLEVVTPTLSRRTTVVLQVENVINKKYILWNVYLPNAVQQPTAPSGKLGRPMHRPTVNRGIGCLVPIRISFEPHILSYAVRTTAIRLK